MIIINKYWGYADREEQDSKEIYEDMMYIKDYFEAIIKNVEELNDKEIMKVLNPTDDPLSR